MSRHITFFQVHVRFLRHHVRIWLDHVVLHITIRMDENHHHVALPKKKSANVLLSWHPLCIDFFVQKSFLDAHAIGMFACFCGYLCLFRLYFGCSHIRTTSSAMFTHFVKHNKGYHKKHRFLLMP